MAKLLSAGDTVEWIPPGQDALPEDRRVRYRLAVPVPMLRLKFRRRCATLGARQVTPRDLVNAIAAALAAMEPAAEDAAVRDRNLALVHEVQAAWDSYVARLGAGDFDGEAGAAAMLAERQEAAPLEATVEAIGRALVDYSEPVARLYAQADTYAEAAGMAAADVFMTGWQGLSQPFRRVAEGLPDAVMMAIPELHLRLLAYHIETLFAPTEAERGNSAPPSSSQSAETSSAAASTAPPTAP